MGDLCPAELGPLGEAGRIHLVGPKTRGRCPHKANLAKAL